MNKVILIGRLARDPDMRTTGSGTTMTRFTIAVNRPFNPQNNANQPQADFIGCIAWRRQAENLAKYMKKGSQIGITGKLRTGSYEAQDGTTRYTTAVRVNELTFLESKPKDGRPEPEYDGYDALPDEDEEETNEVENDPFKDFGESVEISDDDLPF